MAKQPTVKRVFSPDKIASLSPASRLLLIAAVYQVQRNFGTSASSWTANSLIGYIVQLGIGCPQGCHDIRQQMPQIMANGNYALNRFIKYAINEEYPYAPILLNMYE